MSLETDALRALQQKNAELAHENRDLRDELYRLRGAIGALKDLQDSLRHVTPDADVHALLSRILGWALEAVDSENGSLLLLDEETGELVFVEVHGPYRDVLTGYRLPPGEGIAGWVVSNRQAELITDVQREPRFFPMVDQTTGFRTTSLICVPLIHEGRTLGAIETVNRRGGEPFSEEDLDVLLLVAHLATETLARAE